MNDRVESPSLGQVRPEASRRLPYSFARRHGVLLSGVENGRAVLYYRSGVALEAINESRRFADRPLQLHVASPEQFDRLLQQEYEQGSDGMQVMDDFGDNLDLSQVAAQLAEPEDLLDAEDDAPIIRLINALLTEAIKVNASDIHVESFEQRLAVRFRVDGVLRQVMQPRAALGPLIISRIKVMARLDIAERRVPQDGRISLRIAGRAVDVRVSTLPAGHGERIVMRLLDKQAGRLELESLGMSGPDQEAMNDLIHRAHGIILVTGPTGSGKTTSLYAVLSRLNNTSRNIMTVEDPIEYYLDGIGQTQVNTKVDMTFARGLRAILRQDPDVVMVGEIRDLETAQIAVQASLTGHLVLSTLHTNSAVGAVTRLRDMGVEPFLLSSSLVGVVAQRLVRVLCPDCRRPHVADPALCRSLGLSEDDPPTLWMPEGCESCNHTGYRGRTGIYEVVRLDDGIRALIHQSAGEHELERYARQHSGSIREDGVRRILRGETSVEEVIRVTKAD